MYLSRRFDIGPLVFVFLLCAVTADFSVVAYHPTDDVAVNCGSVGNSSALDGREWVGDVGSRFILSRKQVGKSTGSRAVHTSLSGDPVPYLTARASHSSFFYAFKLRPGPIFVRLHFNPASYIGFETSVDSFTIRAGPYTLLHDFSASLAARFLGVVSFSKEFCVNVEAGPEFRVTFSPSRNGNDTYAFVNGLEIVSMPSGLYHTVQGEAGADVVGPQSYTFYVDNTTALETVHRLNVGGATVSPIEDTGMFRRWSKDSDYLLQKTRVFQANHATSMIKHTKTQTFSAPLKVYQTSWATRSSTNKHSTTLTWKFAVDSGFRYLVRLHFCQHEPEKRTKNSRGKLEIVINDQSVEKNAGVAKWGGGYGYKDYVTTMRGDKTEGKRDLSIVMASKNGFADGNLNGLELFKLSNPDDSLAGPNPVFEPRSSSFRMPKLPAFGTVNADATKLIVAMTALNVIVYVQRWIWEETLGKKTTPTVPSRDNRCRQFSLAEIKTATRDFDKALVIGMGGFATVYKGVINGTEMVAVKRMSSRSPEGDREFWTEIETICGLRHNHLVSLIGYCDGGTEMILVYEYMARGTLAEHLFEPGGCSSPLSWDQRLRVCVGAARGLDYLHTGTHHGVIHRDVKTSNILLDENFIGKVSDFGLDPDYFLSRKLSRKSDVYAFGAVMFEVLCGRPAVDPGLEEDQRSLAVWARQGVREGNLDEIIDPRLRGVISPRCLKVFVELADKCLENRPRKRPTMANVVTILEFALEQQEIGDWFVPEEQTTQSYSPRSEDRYVTSPLKSTPKKGLRHNRRKSWRWDLLWNGAKPSKTESFASVNSSKIDDASCRRFSLTEIQSATNDFDETLIIGAGDFSIVYRGYIDGRSRTVAMKRLKKFTTEKKTDWASDFCKEIETLSRLRHPNIVALIGYCYHKSETILVYDYMANGNLRSRLYGRESVDPLTWKQRLRICVDVADGLDFLHTGGGRTVLHRDLNPRNILIDDTWVAKVSDYGLSKVGPLYAVSENLTCVLGSCLEYLDPEYMISNGAKLTDKSDVYSFGLVLLEVLSGRKLEDHMVERDRVFLKSWVKNNVAKRTVHKTIDPRLNGKMAPECLKEFIEIAEGCLDDQRTKRPSMSEVVKGLKLAIQRQEAAEAAKPHFCSFTLRSN